MNKTNILLIDDDEIYLFVASNILKKLSNTLNIKTFKDGAEAIEFIAHTSDDGLTLPDIILLDINMPYMDGWQFLEEFRSLKSQKENHEDIFIYMVTSSDREEDRERAKEFENLTGYLIKPVSRDKLKGVLDDVYQNHF